ncbi:hypothetical protein J4446_00155 [Candidatus Woesearchaeota archaeon]|nr:hypothetical protein [Candidatus Woesearchaeota archaeon]
MKLIQIRNEPKEWYDEDNDKFREIVEENSMILDFQDDDNEVLSLHLTKTQFKKLKDKEICFKISGGKNE